MAAVEATGPRVLLVDDEPRLLSALERVLRREPYRLESVSNAAAALDRLAGPPAIDLVVSDHKMPGMSGIELLAIVRVRWPDCARILLSGWTAGIPEDDLDAAGLHAQHPKPWDDVELKRSIRHALGLPAQGE